MGLAGRADKLQRRTDVEYGAAAHLEVRESRARRVERPLQVDIDDGPEAVRGQRFGRAHEIAGGAVHEDVETAERCSGRGDDGVDRRRVAYIGGGGKRADSSRADLGRGRVQVLG